ncbi:putative aculeacin a acylase transmembrane protein [Caballeronia novacaledonica]|uniref:Putative aculeacin a acylase transmembrane protein n=1 Tax=Caballeronia novacaledonica TaxID=1544861 RepID=A0A2U3IDH1_9BURK|nr:penicillin acylase family protein [Caballeronia novacaledonica]SPB18267.1 putative aculeacin a acylase transmembrane protein [Caballeronia novacaledonica]
MHRSFHIARALVIAAALIAGCASHTGSSGPYQVTVSRTSDGVPHIRADDWGSLGYGVGYSQAQDDLCTLADSFVTWRGERSANFGPEARATAPSSFGQPRNLDADFFFRLMADDAAVARYKAAQPAKLRQMIDGFSDGYDRYVDELRSGRFPGAHAQCASAPWAGHITSDDVYRRLIAISLAGGAARFLEGIANAAPPGAGTPAPKPAQQVSMNVGGHVGIGSNALAFGGARTPDGKSLLFGNPHWFWSGPDRFYQAQLTIPGQLDVAGVSFLAVPVIVIGFNRDIAWTHTVSQARRFGMFELKLSPGDPTRYVYDGKEERMQPVRITVQTKDRASGALVPVTRTLYRSRFGPLVDLSAMSPALAWNAQHAFALRDVNADNARAFENFLAWNQAKSLDDFIAIQKRFAAMPWVNTFAIGRDDRRAWFADIGAVPNAPDTLVAACTTPLGKAFDAKAPGVPFLDGSRSACFWDRGDHNAMQDDALPAARMPSLASVDYVGNFNGSYWLTDPRTPLTGFDRVTGETGTEQSLRTRLGHALAARLIAQPEGVTRATLERAVLDSTSMSERLFRRPLLDTVCRPGSEPRAVEIARKDGQRSVVDLAEPCRVLRDWNGTAATDARGANLWDQFWRRASEIPDAQLYSTPFDPQRPLATPAGLQGMNAALAKALADAALALKRNGFALDSTRGDVLYAVDGDAKIPLYGGCDPEGYFTVACPLHELNREGLKLDRDAHGNSYVQVVGFDADGPHADTLLAHSESDDPASPHYRDGTRRYAVKAWSRFAFSEREIESSPGVMSSTLTGMRSVMSSIVMSRELSLSN